MKIFSNFDTKFRDKVLEKRKETFKESQILVITRSKHYLIFRVILPFVLMLLIAAVFVIFFERYSIDWYVYVPLALVWGLMIWFRTIHKFLKYKYDFTIVDPKGITTYKQKGILHSFLKQIPANRIRSIQICRNNILENIFGYGSVDILTDFAENMHIGEDGEVPSVIGMTYVDAPYKVKNQITDLCFK